MTDKKKTRKIPPQIVADVMYKSDLQCCICKKEDVQIHHLNGNKYDHRADNLACLCLPHHDKATTTSLTRRISKETIIKYREKHYRDLEKNRKTTSKVFSHKINTLTEDALLTASKNAIIIIDLVKIKEEYFGAKWEQKMEVLHKIDKYSNHSNHRVAYEILDFLKLVAGQTRSGMTNQLAISVSTSAMDFCPSFYEENERTSAIKLAKTCIHIGDNIAYDALIHLRNLSVAMWGLSVMKYVYRTAKEYKITELTKEVLKQYDELESTLKRPERTDLGNAQELVKVFKADLNEWDLSLPVLPTHLMDQVNIDSHKADARNFDRGSKT